MIAWTPFTLGGAGAKTAICLIALNTQQVA